MEKINQKVYEYPKTQKSLSRDTNMLPIKYQKSSYIKYFQNLDPIMADTQVLLNHPQTNFKKMTCPKNFWMHLFLESIAVLGKICL